MDYYSKPKRESFKFSLIGLKKGDVLIFVPTGLSVTVFSDNSILYNDVEYKLSAFVKAYIPEEQQNAAGTYRGPKYFSYNGKLLTDLRDEMEKKNI